jgi:hypothetical protein
MARMPFVVLGLVLTACGPGQADVEPVVCEQVEELSPFVLPWLASPHDIDGDGHLDFVDDGGPWGPVLDGILEPTFSWGDGDLHFETTVGPTFYGYPDPSNATIVFADIDGDGDDDIVHHASTAFDTGPNEIVFHTSLQTAPRVFAMPVEATPAGLDDSAYLTAADLDGDGDDELVAIGELPGSEQRWLYTIATEGGTLGPVIPGFESSGAIEVADLDGDARAELLVLHSDGWDVGMPSSLSVVQAGSDGALLELAVHDAGPGTGYLAEDMQAADFDGDGALDLFVENFDALRLFRGHGDDTLSDAGRLEIPDIDALMADCEGSDCALIWQARAGDFDHDGAAELVIVLGTSTLGHPTLGVWLVDDVLAKTPEFIAYHPPLEDFWRFTVADFDADGCADLLFGELLLGSCPLRACD